MKTQERSRPAHSVKDLRNPTVRAEFRAVIHELGQNLLFPEIAQFSPGGFLPLLVILLSTISIDTGRQIRGLRFFVLEE